MLPAFHDHPQDTRAGSGVPGEQNAYAAGETLRWDGHYHCHSLVKQYEKW